MPSRSSKKKPPRDVNALAAYIVAQSTGEAVAEPEEPEAPTSTPEERSAAAAVLGRIGGKKGGKARAAKLTPERRREIGKKAAEARWKRPGRD